MHEGLLFQRQFFFFKKKTLIEARNPHLIVEAAETIHVNNSATRQSLSPSITQHVTLGQIFSKPKISTKNLTSEKPQNSL